ncbi:uncharacterized protein LOC123272439 [Cotesia glomerata]|uniref:Uncharacterized protein n=1 Tax=Cotesia glomerata TaxID=32391 RepID=A0AAV7J3H7_COTGL|nr:uncharacterized protein LOC123272439 [Cotesia glomerata]KAH0564480.1 hypothetical protein KQX54_012295 [Cotesia glomerata]
MDLVYMPEIMTYGSFRAPTLRDYEQPWNKNYFQYGKSPSNTTTRQQQEHLQQQLRANSKKEHCHLCKESKRRSLGAYIKGKGRSISCNEIHEEVEEEDEEIDNARDNKNQSSDTKTCKPSVKNNEKIATKL